MNNAQQTITRSIPLRYSVKDRMARFAVAQAKEDEAPVGDDPYVAYAMLLEFAADNDEQLHSWLMQCGRTAFVRAWRAY